MRKTKICAAINGSGAATGTGALSAREAACLNKSKGDYCEFYDDNGSVRSILSRTLSSEKALFSSLNMMARTATLAVSR